MAGPSGHRYAPMQAQPPDEERQALDEERLLEEEGDHGFARDPRLPRRLGLGFDGQVMRRAAPAAVVLALVLAATVLLVRRSGEPVRSAGSFVELDGFTSPAPEASEEAMGPPPLPPAPLELLSWTDARAKARETLARLTEAERDSLLQGLPESNTAEPGFYTGNTAPIRRLGVPALKMQDASSGFRTSQPGEGGTTTCFPSLLSLASSWDPDLLEEVAEAIGREFRSKGANVILGPGVNVHRVASGGRNFEYLSGDDPYLGARLAEAYVRGVQSQNVMAVVKHFAFNEQERNRNWESSNVGERTAWELYYPPFVAALEAGAGAVMCAYNKVNGTYACENDPLLDRDLKSSMGFAGFVMSDWKAAHSTEAVQHGLDMEMPTGQYFVDYKLKALPPGGGAAGRPDPREATQDAALRVLTSMYRLRLDERPGCAPPCLRERAADVRTEAHVALARKAATRSVVVLKNEGGLLPLDLEGDLWKIAVLGPGAAARDTDLMWAGSAYSGGGSSHVSAPRAVSVLEGLRARTGNQVEVVNYTGLDVDWAGAWLRTGEGQGANLAVVVVTADSSETRDRETLSLDSIDDALVEAVSAILPTVVILQTSGAVLTPWRDSVKSIAALFLGGEQAGHAVAAVLFGDEVPTGRLPVMMPASREDAIPPDDNLEVAYAEGLETSYRSPRFKASYPFGHGLSLTDFEYGAPVVAWRGCPLAAIACVELPLTNTGRARGVEVAQAYLEFPPEAQEPPLVLKGFRRSSLLLPGDREVLRFVFTERDLSIYRPGTGWVLQSDVWARFGASSADLRSWILLRPSPPKTTTSTATTTSSSTETTSTATTTAATTTTATTTRTPTSTTQTSTSAALAVPDGPSLFCLMLVMRGGYEVVLTEAQLSRGVGIAQCDDHLILSDADAGEFSSGRSVQMDGPLKVKYGGPWAVALNTWVFIGVWRKVFEDSQFRKYDWTVKLDADAVFFADRLRGELRKQGVPASRKVFFNNCKWDAMHGPVEVISNAAMLGYSERMQECIDTGVSNWDTEGEDVFVRRCLSHLGVVAVDDFRLLSETECREQISPCTSGKVAFHPFKDVKSWFECLQQARESETTSTTSSTTSTTSTTSMTSSMSTSSASSALRLYTHDRNPHGIRMA